MSDRPKGGRPIHPEECLSESEDQGADRFAHVVRARVLRKIVG